MIIFDDEISKESIRDLIDDIKSSISEGNIADVYLSTPGGEVHYVQMLFEILIKFDSYIKIHIFKEMSSCGFILLYLLNKHKVKIYMHESYFITVAHLADISSSSRTPLKIKDLTTEYHSRFASIILKMAKSAKLSKLQIQEISDGKDVILSKDDTLRIFPNITYLPLI